jgi:hypothetical protein
MLGSVDTVIEAGLSLSLCHRCRSRASALLGQFFWMRQGEVTRRDALTLWVGLGAIFGLSFGAAYGSVLGFLALLQPGVALLGALVGLVYGGVVGLVAGVGFGALNGLVATLVFSRWVLAHLKFTRQRLAGVAAAVTSGCVTTAIFHCTWSAGDIWYVYVPLVIAVCITLVVSQIIDIEDPRERCQN